jgi:hypothetical protein
MGISAASRSTCWSATYTNTDHPEGGAESQIRFQVNFMFPEKPK